MNCDIALYIHIPFCRRKCGYCSFVSYQGREADIPAYVKALEKELALRTAGQRVCTIYLGGGTPSLLSPEKVGDILSTIRSLFVVDEGAEVTIEANPGTVDEPYLAAIRKLGVNRLSLGIQSLNNSELALLGRIHTAVEARDAVRFARGSRFANLSIDLIYGLPGQTMAGWQTTLEEVAALGTEHLSLYPLSLDDDVPLLLAIERGEVPAIDPDCTADQYELAEDLLSEHGYRHYEISNWAREGRECRHNMVYWRNLPYLGVGVAAHSYVDGHRFANTTDLDRYLDAFSGDIPMVRDMDEEIGLKLQLSEAVILGLRLSDGVGLDDIQGRFGIDLLREYGQQVDELADLGLLECAGQRIRLTRRGRLLGNEVFWRFLPIA
jgi:oxygen-independent coproporphyrinogen-3 oxidase